MAEAKNFGKNSEQNKEDLGQTSEVKLDKDDLDLEVEIMKEYKDDVRNAFKYEYKRMMVRLKEAQREVGQITRKMCEMKANYRSGDYYEDHLRCGANPNNPHSLNFGQYKC